MHAILEACFMRAKKIMLIPKYSWLMLKILDSEVEQYLIGWPRNMENKVHILTVVSDPTGDYQLRSDVM